MEAVYHALPHASLQPGEGAPPRPQYEGSEHISTEDPQQLVRTSTFSTGIADHITVHVNSGIETRSITCIPST